MLKKDLNYFFKAVNYTEEELAVQSMQLWFLFTLTININMSVTPDYRATTAKLIDLFFFSQKMWKLSLNISLNIFGSTQSDYWKLYIYFSVAEYLGTQWER